MHHAEAIKQTDTSGRIEIFDYPASPDAPSVPEWTLWANAEDAGQGTSRAVHAHVSDARAAETRLRAEFEARLAEEKGRAFEAGRLQGSQAEREAQNDSHRMEQQGRAEQVTGLIASFTQERDRYMGSVEQEVVKLALAVAARILRREAQMDPLLLTGAVRVALGQLSGSTQVRLRVPPSELDLWTEAITLVPNLPLKPVVTAGEGMRLGDCLIESELGTVDLGIRAQLGEIERGFFDRTGGSNSGRNREDDIERVASLSGNVRECGA